MRECVSPSKASAARGADFSTTEHKLEFTNRKLPRQSLEKMSRCAISSVKPHTLMSSPVYVYLKANEKFVAVKGPLDFFTPEELERLAPYQAFYLPEFFEDSAPYRDAAKKVRALLLEPAAVGKGGAGDGNVSLGAPPFEVSDSILSLMGPLWWRQKGGKPGIEPFLLILFINELLDPFDPEFLKRAREASVEAFERGLARACWAVFMALHLGYCDLEYLGRVRERVIQENVWQAAPPERKSEVDEIIALASNSLRTIGLRQLSAEYFDRRPERVSLKMISRLERIEQAFLSSGRGAPSIYGERGFIDV